MSFVAFRRVSLALALAAALAAPVRADDTLRVGKASVTAFAMMPLVVGVDRGLYKKHGIDVEIVDFSGGAKLHQAIAAGSLDIGIGAGPELAFIAKGSPELAIANPAGPPLFIGIVVPEDSKVRTTNDLKGLRIGVSSVNSLTYWMALELARQRGWGHDGVTPVAIGSETTSVIAAFRTHAVDADIGGTAMAFQLEEQKIGRFVQSVSDFIGNISADTIFASNRLIESKPDAIRRFLAGWFNSVDFMRRDKGETVRIARGITGFSEYVQAREYDQSIRMFNEDGKFDAESLANLKRSFADLKLLDSAPDMATLYTEQFLPKR